MKNTISLTAQKNSKLENFAHIENDHYYWWASWYAEVLGYKSLSTFKNVIDKANKTLVLLDSNAETNIIPTEHNGKADYKLSKFACFLLALLADNRKPIVKKARAYFLNDLEELNHILTHDQYLTRSIARAELKTLNKTLGRAARRAHVKDFQYFMNKGYMGMYNRTMSEIKDDRGIEQRKDMNNYMSNTELAANIFRVSLTIDRLQMLRNPNQEIAAKEHWKIGKNIRNIINNTIGNPPERLPIFRSLKDIQKRLIQSQKELQKTIKDTTPNKLEAST